MDQPYPSSDRDDLSEKPDGEYKFGSLEILVKQTMLIMNRETYSVLDWLGDVGGLNDAIVLILKPFISYISYLSFSLSLTNDMPTTFKRTDHKKKKEQKTSTKDSVNALKKKFETSNMKNNEAYVIM